MADWLGSISAVSVKVAKNGERCRPGTVYLAPDGCNVTVGEQGGELVVLVCPQQPEGVLTPSVNVLIHSVAKVVGQKAICGLLTGMGADGAEGLLAVRQKKGKTFAEAKESCVVYGMPSAAVNLNAASDVMHIDRVRSHLLSLAGCASHTH